jgi:two-component system cell cycle sensor histidine kinase/response regulator CckA
MAEQAVVYLAEGIEIRRPDGQRVPIDDSAAPIRDDAGTVTGAVVVFRDASARLRLQQQQREAELRLHEARHLESLGVLAGGLAHDLNNALTVILGNVNLCQETAPAGLADPLDQIAESARTAADLCRQMLDGAGRGPLQRRVVDLRAAIDAAVKAERTRLQVADLVDIQLQGDRPPVAILADPVRLGQVLGNLLRNAVEALAGREGTVVVRYGPIRLPDPSVAQWRNAQEVPGGDYAWIEVADDGPGMPEHVRRRVFEPFFTTKFTGRGLGLASVHGIVHQHGGSIHVESDPGHGTSFRLLWPAPPPGAG